MDIEEVKEDSSLYAIAKLFLNTLWGYFCKNPDEHQQTNIFTQNGKFQQWVNGLPLGDRIGEFTNELQPVEHPKGSGEKKRFANGLELRQSY